MKSKDLATAIAAAAEEKQAVDLVVLNLTKLAAFTDYFVICSGRSDTQVRAIADSITDMAKQKERPILGMEGYKQGHWILLDYGDVVAHIFYHELREFYDLERLWFDAKKITHSADRA